MSLARLRSAGLSRHVRWTLWLVLGLALVGCRGGPDPVCISHCERENDACMMNASEAHAIQACDDGMSRCLAYCR